MEQEEALPEVLYKYRSWGTDKDDDKTRQYTKDLLNGIFYFANPLTELNDPFDCKLDFDFRATQEEIKDYYINRSSILNGYNPIEKEEKINLYIKNHDEMLKSESKIIEHNKIVREDTLKNTGVFSLSENPSNILMWTHYSDNQKGICVGIKHRPESRFFYEVNTKTGHIRHTNKINYRSNKSKLNYYRSKDRKKINWAVFSKTKNWEYEKEWRVFDNDFQGKFKANKTLITEIIFGCEMPDEHKKEIMDLTAGRNIRYKQASKTMNPIGLKLVDL